jgi:glutathione S-transferase
MKLIIGNKRYSSWSLRPWVLMKHFDIHFEEKLIPLDQPNTTTEILKFSPSNKVPVLIDGSVSVWESLAIAEYLNEKFVEKQMWPKDQKLRGMARAVSNEMHGGFLTMRNLMPHDLKKELKNFDASPAKADIERIQQIWRTSIELSGGPFLFGAFSIADAMFAPVVNRFVSYGVKVDKVCSAYIKTIRELSAHQMWIAAGLKEDLTMPRYEK